MDKYLDNSKPVNLKGTIFICNELCNLTFNYLDQSGMSLSNLNNILLLTYNSKSTINFNGGNSFGSSASQYAVQSIRILAPPIHIIQDIASKMELVISHLSNDGSGRYQHLCILLNPSDKAADRSTATWKLFEKFANQLPAQNVSGKAVDGLVAWNATDLLPAESDRSFYTYNADAKNNFIVFTNPVNVPSAFLRNLITKVIGQSPYDTLLATTIPTDSPANIVIFAKRNVTDGNESPSQPSPQPAPVPSNPSTPNTSNTSNNNSNDNSNDNGNDNGNDTINDDENPVDGVCKDECTETPIWLRIIISLLISIGFIGLIILRFTEAFAYRDVVRYLTYFTFVGAVLIFFWSQAIISGINLAHCQSQISWLTPIWIVLGILSVLATVVGGVYFGYNWFISSRVVDEAGSPVPTIETMEQNPFIQMFLKPLNFIVPRKPYTSPNIKGNTDKYLDSGSESNNEGSQANVQLENDFDRVKPDISPVSAKTYTPSTAAPSASSQQKVNPDYSPIPLPSSNKSPVVGAYQPSPVAQEQSEPIYGDLTLRPQTPETVVGPSQPAPSSIPQSSQLEAKNAEPTDEGKPFDAPIRFTPDVSLEQLDNEKINNELKQRALNTKQQALKNIKNRIKSTVNKKTRDALQTQASNLKQQIDGNSKTLADESVKKLEKAIDSLKNKIEEYKNLVSKKQFTPEVTEPVIKDWEQQKQDLQKQLKKLKSLQTKSMQVSLPKSSMRLIEPKVSSPTPTKPPVRPFIQNNNEIKVLPT